MPPDLVAKVGDCVAQVGRSGSTMGGNGLCGEALRSLPVQAEGGRGWQAQSHSLCLTTPPLSNLQRRSSIPPHTHLHTYNRAWSTCSWLLPRASRHRSSTHLTHIFTPACQGLESLQLAAAKGVTMCFGSDLLGDLHAYQSREFELRARVLPSKDVIRAATLNCARLFGMEVSDMPALDSCSSSMQYTAHMVPCMEVSHDVPAPLTLLLHARMPHAWQ